MPSNERLEFLGDCVLGLAITEELYRRFPSLTEGQLTKLRATLVQGEALARLARSLGLGEYLYLGKGEERSGGRRRRSILAGALEALVGATYLDKGFSIAKEFILKLVGPEMATSIDRLTREDYKSRLQELAQGRWQLTPTYRTVAETGPDHSKEFTIEVLVGDRALGQGSAKSKQEAEKRAAKAALEGLQEEEAAAGVRQLS